MADYVNVGKLGDFTPNEMKAVDFNGEKVAVVKIGDKFHAFSNYCTHVGVYMTGGYVTETEAVCDLRLCRRRLQSGDWSARARPRLRTATDFCRPRGRGRGPGRAAARDLSGHPAPPAQGLRTARSPAVTSSFRNDLAPIRRFFA